MRSHAPVGEAEAFLIVAFPIVRWIRVAAPQQVMAVRGAAVQPGALEIIPDI